MTNYLLRFEVCVDGLQHEEAEDVANHVQRRVAQDTGLLLVMDDVVYLDSDDEYNWILICHMLIDVAEYEFPEDVADTVQRDIAQCTGYGVVLSDIEDFEYEDSVD